ncbi:MAG: hypothetical protein CTY20_15430 [Hyphomicrobium sp.]|nr:MAG: hypothetical protein CTY20_15430 [Hyphomicrobium sp.]
MTLTANRYSIIHPVPITAEGHTLGQWFNTRACEHPALIMQLTTLQYAIIEGTKVSVHVSSAAEAKAALKELKHKKKELQFAKRGLQRERLSLERAARKPKPSKYAIGRLWQQMKAARNTVARVASSTARTPATIDREIQALDETVFNVDSCLLQLQGKLLKY